jgi:hypothetical protein
MEKFNEIDLTAEDSVLREMGLRRAVFLLIASLLLWCGSMLLILDLANASDNWAQVALIGLFLVAIGVSWLWADFFEVTTWFAREASQRFDAVDDFNPVEVVVERPKNHRTNRDGLHAGAFVDQENSQARDADEARVQEE